MTGGPWVVSPGDLVLGRETSLLPVPLPRIPWGSTSAP